VRESPVPANRKTADDDDEKDSEMTLNIIFPTEWALKGPEGTGEDCLPIATVAYPPLEPLQG